MSDPNAGQRAEPQYEQRYCAFVDILGFRELISSLDKGELEVKRLRAILQQVQNPFRSITDSEMNFRSQSISDAVALSTRVTANGLRHLLFVLEDLYLGLLFEGYLLRGAIVKGQLYHDDNVVFGRALIDAYQLETQIVRFPRIMLTRQVALDASNSPIRDVLKPCIRESEDAPYYLHVLRSFAHDIEHELKKDPDLDPVDLTAGMRTSCGARCRSVPHFLIVTDIDGMIWHLAAGGFLLIFLG